VNLKTVRGLALRGRNRVQGFHSIDALERAGLVVGKGVDIGARTYIDKAFAWAIEIGDRTTISWGVSVIAHDAAARRHLGYTEVRPVRIGAQVYIGAGAIILPGAVIGDGTVIGAGSIVRGEIPAGVIAAGNPCRTITTVEDFVKRHELEWEGIPRLEQNRASMSEADIRDAQEALRRHGRLYLR
jgi:acetyltransferase-like isoleucine patch superfamily enzyme